MKKRTIITYPSLHRVLSAEKALRLAESPRFHVRTTPTPPGLGNAICGMSIEILDEQEKKAILDYLAIHNLLPEGVHSVD